MSDFDTRTARESQSFSDPRLTGLADFPSPATADLDALLIEFRDVPAKVEPAPEPEPAPAPKTPPSLSLRELARTLGPAFRAREAAHKAHAPIRAAEDAERRGREERDAADVERAKKAGLYVCGGIRSPEWVATFARIMGRRDDDCGVGEIEIAVASALRSRRYRERHVPELAEIAQAGKAERQDTKARNIAAADARRNIDADGVALDRWLTAHNCPGTAARIRLHRVALLAIRHAQALRAETRHRIAIVAHLQAMVATDPAVFGEWVPTKKSVERLRATLREIEAEGAFNVVGEDEIEDVDLETALAEIEAETAEHHTAPAQIDDIALAEALAQIEDEENSNSGDNISAGPNISIAIPKRQGYSFSSE